MINIYHSKYMGKIQVMFQTTNQTNATPICLKTPNMKHILSLKTIRKWNMKTITISPSVMRAKCRLLAVPIKFMHPFTNSSRSTKPFASLAVSKWKGASQIMVGACFSRFVEGLQAESSQFLWSQCESTRECGWWMVESMFYIIINKRIIKV